MNCLFCKMPIDGGMDIANCPHCGLTQIPEELSSVVDEIITESGVDKDLGQFKICRYLARFTGNDSASDNRCAALDDKNAIQRVLKQPLPAPLEQVDNLIRLLAESGQCFDWQRISFYVFAHQIGCRNFDFFCQIVRSVEQRQLVSISGDISDQGISNAPPGLLTVQGWQHYDELLKGKTSSHKGFMAMQFDNKPLRQILNENLKPAAKQAGFDLATLDDQPAAGLIDDHILVAIRTSAFVVADLSDKNSGAYFEAGFALGLGKQVLFTCEREKWEKNKTHFDTNHRRTILWDFKKPEEAAKDLKAAIRATLPDKAKMSDEDE